MNRRRFIACWLGGLFTGVVTFGLRADEPGPLIQREWQVDGEKREALVYLPGNAAAGNKAGLPAPVIFAFHGHGGNMRNASKMFHFHEIWSEAVVIYMQGLSTPGKLTDPEGKKPGWQHQVGSEGDRDLKFFDAVLASLNREHRVDSARVYAAGHSNGGAFTYLLWGARGDQLAALAPSAASVSGSLGARKPRPVIHFAGINDPLVKFTWQEKTLDRVRLLNRCTIGTSWPDVEGATFYQSPTGEPVVLFLHTEQHKLPSVAPEIMVKFFKRYRLPAVSGDAR